VPIGVCQRLGHTVRKVVLLDHPAGLCPQAGSEGGVQREGVKCFGEGGGVVVGEQEARLAVSYDFGDGVGAGGYDRLSERQRSDRAGRTEGHGCGGERQNKHVGLGQRPVALFVGHKAGPQLDAGGVAGLRDPFPQPGHVAGGALARRHPAENQQALPGGSRFALQAVEKNLEGVQEGFDPFSRIEETEKDSQNGVLRRKC
jgi:hypothetical protein